MVAFFVLAAASHRFFPAGIFRPAEDVTLILRSPTRSPRFRLSSASPPIPWDLPLRQAAWTILWTVLFQFRPCRRDGDPLAVPYPSQVQRLILLCNNRPYPMDTSSG